MEQLIIDKLKETIHILRLNTGEQLIGLVGNQQDNYIVFCFPYVVIENEIKEEFCQMQSNRNFFLSRLAIQFVKRPKSIYIDKYIECLLKNNIIEFESFIKEFSESMVEGEDTENLKKDRVLH